MRIAETDSPPSLQWAAAIVPPALGATILMTSVQPFAIFVQTFASLSFMLSQPWRPRLGCAFRFGEAKNPGPESPRDEMFINLGICNPTSIFHKFDTIDQLFASANLHILCLSETSATDHTQQCFQKQARAKNITCLWSPPVAAQSTRITGEQSKRGRAGGTAIMSQLPCRLARNPREQDWITSTRFCHSVCNLGPMLVQVVCIYGLTSSHAGSKEFTDSMLQMILQRVTLIGLPYIIAGDFNLEPSTLPNWDSFVNFGCTDLIQAHLDLTGHVMPNTCLEATKPDNAILSKELRPFLTHINVLEATWFTTHRPVALSFCFPIKPILTKVLRQPKTWIGLGVDQEDIQKVMPLLATCDAPTTLEEWGKQVEFAVDLAIQHAKPCTFPVSKLPKKYRGRCMPCSPVKTSLTSQLRPARNGEYDPENEVFCIATKRCIKQLRRIQSLQRRMKKVETEGCVWFRAQQELQTEWKKILHCTCFKMPFPRWIQAIPECGPAPIWPSSHWLHTLTQFVRFEVDKMVQHEHQQSLAFAKYKITCDEKYHGAKHAFANIRNATPLPVTHAKKEQTWEVTCTWDVQDSTVTCHMPTPHELCPSLPVAVSSQVAHIVELQSTHFVAKLDKMPECLPEQVTIKQSKVYMHPHEVAEQLSDFWLPLWQAPHRPITVEDQLLFQEVVSCLPVRPNVQLDFSLPAWKHAISRIKPTAARGIDAIAPAELKMLPDLLIERLRQVCMSYQTGFPPWFMTAKVTPLNKTTGTPAGHEIRPITIFSLLYRLWASLICKQTLQQWNNWCPADISGLMPGRGAHLASYDTQAMLEFHRFSHEFPSGLTFDLKKCFNCIRQNIAFLLLVEMKLPPELVQQMQRSIEHMSRYWQISNEHFGPHHATWGFAEGDPFSVLIMISIALAWTSFIKAKCPSIFPSAYADNWAWKALETEPQIDAFKHTLQLTHLFGLQIDSKKSWVWAVDTNHANALLGAFNEILPGATFCRAHHERDLGLEILYSGGVRLGHRKQRFEQGLEKLQKLQKQHLSLSLKTRLLLASVYPSMFHGAEIHPVSIDKVDKLRSKVAAAVVGESHNLNPAVALLLAGNQVLDPNVWLILQAIRAAQTWLAVQDPDIQATFFKVASQFLGGALAVKGPAAALKCYLRRVDWDISPDGSIHTSAFEKLHLLSDPLAKFNMHLTLAWQRDLLKLYTTRRNWHYLPDISRLDTIQVLRKFEDKQRRQLIRHSGAFQLETQKQQWTTATDQCQFCGETDSYAHRLLNCPTFADVREPYLPLLKYIDEHETHHADMPVVFVHPESDAHRLLHAAEPAAIIADAIRSECESRAAAHEQIHIFTDGSCQHPSSPTTRYCAFSGVLDLLHADADRVDAAERAVALHAAPTTFQGIFAARLKGEQSINRAEVEAIITALQLPGRLVIHTDSAYAILCVQRCRSAASSHDLRRFANFDLLTRLSKALRAEVTVCKVDAHKEPFGVSCPLQRYFTFGNAQADATAVYACQHLQPAWAASLEAKHHDIHSDRDMLHQCYNLILELQDARAACSQTLGRDDDTSAAAHVSQQANVSQELATWRPINGIEIEMPDTTAWENFFSWGPSLAREFAHWLVHCVWQSELEPGMAGRVGVSWLELALSFSLFRKKVLPIIRTDDENNQLLMFTEDNDDISHHYITHADQAHSFQTMWGQAIGWMPAGTIPVVPRGLCSSLYVQGFLQQTSGLQMRISFFGQETIAKYVVDHLRNQKDYSQLCRYHWVEARSSSLEVADWCHLQVQQRKFKRDAKRS